ncbi:conserved hypothetical protein [Coccidioides posadasii str. Silveira]|uniref:Uncharacterized protein n=1 Tax=Coccidioides posadasii (strain RMSCC 757 / Silveira) TaxID=443226 RepID=E9DEF5_COCPS|nr:conserved hypothetical protein [Coccidioides posadasii str. Silveira]
MGLFEPPFILHVLRREDPNALDDKFTPYPNLAADINDVSIRLSHPAQLYEWNGCSSDERNAISEAYRDFDHLANQPDVFADIDWNHQAAKDFWGPVKGDGKVSDKRKEEIQGAFKSMGRIHRNWWSWEPLSIPGPKCPSGSNGNAGSNDPENICGTRTPKQSVQVDQTAQRAASFSMEKIEDCLHGAMQRGLHATSEGKFKSKGLQDNLENWDNRGRVFFHEAVHMASLMYPQDKTPSVEDAEIKFKEADSYAFFALAKYVEKQIDRYPTPGSKKVESEPQIAGQTAKDSDGKRARYVPLHTRGGDDGLLGDKELEYKDQHIKEFSIPACPDF